MKKRNIRRPRKRCNISQPILESSSITNEQLLDFVYHALQEMRPLCSNSDTHHHRSISHRIGDSRISIEVSLTPWNIHSEAFANIYKYLSDPTRSDNSDSLSVEIKACHIVKTEIKISCADSSGVFHNRKVCS